MVTRERTLEDIRQAGLDALERELGPVDTLLFFGAFAPKGRDYSRDRHDWVDSLTADDIQRMVEELRATGNVTRSANEPRIAVRNPVDWLEENDDVIG